jgi:hypothetical protein
LPGEGLHQIDRAWGKFAGRLTADHQRSDELVRADERNDQKSTETRARNGVEHERGSGMRSIGKLNWHALYRQLAEDRLAPMALLTLHRRDQRLIHAVAGAEVEIPSVFIVYEDCSGFGPG